jgi:predicted Rossmann fold nucleotide-binding protein DprA/Smf involved in DNA uptake
MIETALSPDAQATALLVGRFGKGALKPLSRKDFNQVARLLHQRGMRPADLFTQVPTDLPIEPDRLTGLISRGTSLALAVDEWNQMGIRFVSRSDETYPARYRKRLKSGSAPILYYAGSLDLLELPTLGVVGSRDASDDGLEASRKLGKQAAAEGIAIVSGDARGIDRAAMEAAFDAGGRVIGVLADSLGKSVLSKRYRQAIAAGQLLLISHAEPDARFTVGQAMERNRYIYAASDAVIVADSDVKGGTWNGAIENLRHRWSPAYVRVGGAQAEGRSALLREGLMEWSARWFETGQALSALFEADMSRDAILPLFTRDSEPAGEQKPVSAITVGTFLTGEAAGLATPRDEEAVPSAARTEASDSEDLYQFFVTRLIPLLRDGKSIAEVAAHFAIEPLQAESWLTWARTEGRVELRQDDIWVSLT